MRAKRAKQYRKLMNAYALSFGFRPPLQILLDADFIRDASRFKMNLGNMLKGTLGGDIIKPMITQCCIRHLYEAPTTNEAEKREKDGWIEVAKQAERRRCGHHELDEPLSTLECVESVVDPKGSGTNKHRYVVASQDPEVRAAMRLLPGVPIVYINRSVMILEPMSSSTEQARAAEERSKIRAGLKGRRGGEDVTKRKRDDDEDTNELNKEGGQESSAPKRRKIKGPKGPNPLSVRKSEKKDLVKSRDVGKGPDHKRSTIRDRVKDTDGEGGDAPRPSLSHVDNDANGDAADGARKRKRKRKPKELGEQSTSGISHHSDE